MPDDAQESHRDVLCERLFDLSPEMLCIARRDGFFERLNPAWSSVVQYSERELGARAIASFVHPDDRELTARALASDARRIVFETRFRCKDGSYRWLEWKLVASNDDGNLYGVVHETTDRRRAEEALRESEQRYRTLFDKAPVGVFLYDTQLVIVECNERFVEVLQSTRDRLVALEMRKLRDRRILPALELSIGGEPAAYDGEYAATTSGAHIWISMRLSPLRDADGRVVGGLGVVADVTEQKAIEDAIIRGEARFRELIERTPDAVAVHRDGRFVYVNPAAVALLGYPRADDLVGRNVASIVHPDDRSKIASRIAEMQATGLPLPLNEERLLKKDGSLLIAEVVALPIEFDGAPAFLVIARDVSERRQMQARLLEADRLVSVGTLAAGVAHEINNPLAYVIMNLDLAAKAAAEQQRAGAHTDDILAMLAVAREGTERMRQIVGDLRSLARADDETRRPVDVQRVLESTIKMANNEIRHRARLVRDYRPVASVIANEARLGQVFLNLLLNAAQAIPEGHAADNEIRVATFDDGDRAVVTVTDSGVGITEDDLRHIFDPFFTTKPIGDGTGLGLSICHSLVTSLGGEISVESRPGGGSTFRVSLPALPPEA